MTPEVDKTTIFKGFKKIAIAIPLMFVGPVIINSSFKNEENPFYYPVLALGIILCLLAMFLFFKGLITMVKGLFNDNEKQ